MMKLIRILFTTGVATVCFSVSPLGRADNGTVDLLVSSLSTATSVQLGDTTVIARGGTGTVTFIRSSGAPFVEGASGNGQFASFSKKSATGFELESDTLVTFSSEDTLQMIFKRKTGDLAPGSSGEGTLYLAGGTGRYAGINGQCKYKVDNLQNNWNVVMAKCQWNK